MKNESVPMNITVAVEPDSSSAPVASSLYKMKHHLNLQRNGIQIDNHIWDSMVYLELTNGKSIQRILAYQFKSFVSTVSKACCIASLTELKSFPLNNDPPCKAEAHSLYS